MSKNSKIVISIFFVIVFCLVSYCVVQIGETQQGILTLTQQLAEQATQKGQSGNIAPESSALQTPESSGQPTEQIAAPSMNATDQGGTENISGDQESTAKVATPEPTMQPEQKPQGQIVYLVPNGKVYHTTPNCSTLARSSTILSGTIEESGKPRVCKKCG